MSDCEEIIEETLEKRHRKEKRDLQAEVTRLKHSVPKGDKKRKKEVNAQIALLEDELRKKQELEVQTQADVASSISQVTLDDVEEKVGAEEGASGGQGKKSKAQKRREKKSEKDKERNERIRQQDIDNLSGVRHLEAAGLKKLLTARNLHTSQIPSDGDCLYAAIVDQLRLTNETTSVAALRLEAAKHMRCHQDEFIPFLCHTDTGDLYTQDDFEKYCDKVESSKEWGGQLEVQALSNVLKHPIEVIQAEGPSLFVGSEFSSPPLLLSYHRHAFGLGEHYNSVLPGIEKEEDEIDASEYT